MKNFDVKSLCLVSFITLTACSSGSDLSTTVAGGGRGGSEYGFVTLSITDAPIDFATQVWIQFDGVEFMPSASSANQGPIVVTFKSPMNIDLLQLQGSKSKALLTNEILPTGSYDYVKLMVTAARDGVLDSYIVLEDGNVHELNMPPGSEVGLAIAGGLEIVANTPSEKTIDFDLRKSIVMNGTGDYEILPVIELVNNELSGSIEGTVKLKTLLSHNCSDFDPMSGNAVYLYEGFNVTPDDVDGVAPEHVRSAKVNFDSATGSFNYSFGFVPFGKYTAAFTCEADLDDPAADDEISFTRTRNVDITSTGVTTLPGNTFRFQGNHHDDDDD
jgi:hypothetical protein